MKMLSPKQERRLQETMPRHMLNVAKVHDMLEQGNSCPADTTKGPLPLLQLPERVYGNAAAGGHSQVTPRPSSIQSDKGTVRSRSGRGDRSAGVGTPLVNLGVSEGNGQSTTTITGPSSRVHKEAAELTLQAMDIFVKRSSEAIKLTNSVFHEWIESEARCRKVWKAYSSRFEKEKA
ncbi:unnamed protein product [Trypanosoma congolense IL3000]|uniref:WGS project CAEQ00000000 data, annotated contig 2374 n=1 Tax=Trypanosoma congolense (strain IL3000) TaxID=1068625 RepID=F9WDK4_TRYCI|nr:unnamed protein product [Trypanosoma congolense IL3000]